MPAIGKLKSQSRSKSVSVDDKKEEEEPVALRLPEIIKVICASILQ